MKQSGGQRVFSFFMRRLATACAVAALALIATLGAKANVVETFMFSGSLKNIFGGSSLAFNGTLDLDFTNDFSDYTFDSLNIRVQGRPVFNQIFSPPSLSSSFASIYATNSANDRLTLFFTPTNPGSWVGFDKGTITTGQLVSGASFGFYYADQGVVTRDSLDPPILAPPPPLSDPPPVIPTAAAPELSTWAMMLVGLAGLAMVAKRRRARSALSGRA